MNDGTRNEGSPGILGSVKALLATFVSMVHGRLELFSVEMEEELARVVAVLVWSIGAMLCAVVGLTFLAVLILLVTGDDSRPLVTAVLAAVFLLVALGSAVLARKVLHAKPRPFDASLTELERDYEGLRRER
jgi:uncharacterized membrane protein YqjE